MAVNGQKRSPASVAARRAGAAKMLRGMALSLEDAREGLRSVPVGVARDAQALAIENAAAMLGDVQKQCRGAHLEADWATAYYLEHAAGLICAATTVPFVSSPSLQLLFGAHAYLGMAWAACNSATTERMKRSRGVAQRLRALALQYPTESAAALNRLLAAERGGVKYDDAEARKVVRNARGAASR